MPIEEQKKGRKKWKWLLIFILLIAAVFAVFYFFVRIYHVNTGYIGVKSSIDNPADNSASYDVKLVNGYVVYIPLMTTLEVYPTTVFSYDLGQKKVYTRDGISLTFSPKVSLQLDETKADYYYKNFKDTYPSKNETIIDAIQNVFANEASTFETDSLIKYKVNFEKQLEKQLADKLKEYGILVKNINSNLEYPEDVKSRVELKVKTEQDILVAETEARLAYIKAESKRQQDSLEYSTLSKLSIQKLFIDKWDGRLASNPEQPIMYRDINSNDDIPSASVVQKIKQPSPIVAKTLEAKDSIK